MAADFQGIKPRVLKCILPVDRRPLEKAEIKDMTWVVDASNKTATSEIVGPSVDEIKGQIKLSDPIVATIAYTDDKAMINGKVVQSYMDGSIQLKLVGLDKDGKPVSGTSEADIAKITKLYFFIFYFNNNSISFTKAFLFARLINAPLASSKVASFSGMYFSIRII